MNNLSRPRRIRRRLLNASLAGLSICTLPNVADAVTRNYDGPDNGLWTTAANWSVNTLPGAGDDAQLGNVSAGTTDLHVTMNSTSPAVYNSVTLNSFALGGTMIVNQTNAATTLYTLTETIGSGTNLNAYNLIAGFHSAETLNVGLNSSGNVFTLSGVGQLRSVLAQNIGVNGSGTFNQSGGNNILDDGFATDATLSLGLNVGSTGVYNMSGGTLYANNIHVGGNGTGTFNQTGGSVGCGYMNIGAQSGSASYSLGNGTLNVYTGYSNSPAINIGAHGTFNLNIGGVLGSYGGVSIYAGGIFNFGGGTLTPGTDVGVEGVMRLNGFNPSVGNISSDGIIESTTASGVLTLTSASADTANFYGTLRDGVGGVFGLTKAGDAQFIQALFGTSTYTGTTTVNSGILRGASLASLSPSSNFLINGGVLDATLFNFTLASIGGSGGVLDIGTTTFSTNTNNATTTFAGTLVGSGSLNKLGTGALTLNGGGAFTGTINVNAGSVKNTVVNGLPVNAAVVLNGAGTTFNVSANQSIASLAGANFSTVNVLGTSTLSVGTNNLPSVYAGGFGGVGTIAKLGTASFTLGTGPLDITSSNTSSTVAFNAIAGTLVLNKADGTNAIGGPLNLVGGVVHLNQSNQISNTSTLTMTSGTLELAGQSETVGNLIGTGGTINLAGGSLTVTASAINTYAGILAGPGTFTKSGAADLTLSNLGGSGANLVANTGKLILTGPVSATGLVANNTGTLRFNANVINLLAGDIRANIGGTAEYAGATITNGYLRGGGTHVILAGSTTTFSGLNIFNSTVITQNGPAVFKNLISGGTINNNVALTFDGVVNSSSGILNVNSTLNAIDFTSNGVINVSGQLLNSASNVYLGGGSRTTIIAGGTLLTPAGTSVELNGGLLTNNGVVNGLTNVNYGSLATGTGSWGIVNVTLGGTFSPGVAGAAFSLVDDAAFGSGATLAIDLAGTTQGSSYDSLVSADHASIAGKLALQTLDEYVPDYGVRHHVVTSFSSRTGVFEHITGIMLTPSKWLAVTYGANGVDVTAALPGDSDLNGSVEFDDLLAVAQHYGQTAGGTWSTGDFDGTGSIVFDDLLTLAQHYGGSILSEGSVSADFAADWALAQSMVPEPMALFVLAPLALRRVRRS